MQDDLFAEQNFDSIQEHLQQNKYRDIGNYPFLTNKSLN